MSSRTRSTRSAPATALALAAGLLLAGCGGDSGAPGVSAAGQDHAAAGHDHSPAVASVSGGQSGRYRGLQLTEPYQKPEFTLTDSTGAAFDFAERTAAGPTLLFFGYTNCPDVCPTTMADTAVAAVPPAVSSVPAPDSDSTGAGCSGSGCPATVGSIQAASVPSL